MKAAARKQQKKIGRPLLGETPRVPISLRIRPELKDALLTRAEKSGRSIAQETELLLESVVEIENETGGPVLFPYLRAMGAVLKSLQEKTGKAPYEDIETYLMARGALNEWIALLPAPTGGEAFPELAEAEKAKSDYDHALERFKKAELDLLKENTTEWESSWSHKGLGGLLSMPEPGSKKFYEDIITKEKEAGNTDAVERYSKLLPYVESKEAASEALDRALEAVKKKIEKLEAEGEKTIRERLSALKLDA